MDIFPRLTSLEILQKIQKDLRDRNIEPEKFEDRIIFMSMFNDIEWRKRGNSKKCISNSEQVKNYTKRFSRGHWTSLGLGDGKKWYGTRSFSPEGKCDSTTTLMMERFKETSHPVFKSIGALNRGILKNTRDTIHFNADASNTELFFRPIHSANQLSLCGAVSSWCEEFGLRPNERELTSERFVAKENEQLRKNVKLEEVNSMVQTPRSDDPASGNRLRDCLENFKTIADVDKGFGESNSSMQRVYAPSC